MSLPVLLRGSPDYDPFRVVFPLQDLEELLKFLIQNHGWLHLAMLRHNWSRLRDNL